MTYDKMNDDEAMVDYSSAVIFQTTRKKSRDGSSKKKKRNAKNLFSTNNNGRNQLINGMLLDVSLNKCNNKEERSSSDDENTAETITSSSSSSIDPASDFLNILDDALELVGEDNNAANKEVRFAKHDLIYEIPHIDDLSDEEVDDVWMNRKEMKEIRRNAIKIVTKIEENDDDSCESSSSSSNERLLTNDDSDADDDEDLLNIRGLDQNTGSYMKRRQATQEFIYETVFRLQPFKQKKNNDQQDAATTGTTVDVDGIIADLYTKYSATELAAALERAKYDEWEAREVYCEEFYN